MKLPVFVVACLSAVLPQTNAFAQNCPLSQGHQSVVIIHPQTAQPSVIHRAPTSTCNSQEPVARQGIVMPSTSTVDGKHFVNAAATIVEKDIVSTAVSAGSFKTLAAALVTVSSAVAQESPDDTPNEKTSLRVSISS